MQAFMHPPLLCAFFNEQLNLVQFVLATGLETTRIMENKSVIAFERNFMFDVMLATL